MCLSALVGRLPARQTLNPMRLARGGRGAAGTSPDTPHRIGQLAHASAGTTCSDATMVMVLTFMTVIVMMSPISGT